MKSSTYFTMAQCLTSNGNRESNWEVLNDEGNPNDECRKRASQASCECMHLVIRASDFVIG